MITKFNLLQFSQRNNISRLKMSSVSIEAMREAHERTRPFIHCTPIMTSERIDKIVGANVFFKCDHLQKTGSFKSRGALNSVLLAKQNGAKSVITHSSGNHGQALAWSASKTGIDCTIVVPKNAPQAKISAMNEYGANVVLCEPTMKAREQTCAQIAADNKDCIVIEPFNTATMINGHASIVFEIIEQCGDKIDSVFLSIGGGGLASSIVYSLRKLRPDIRVYLVEPEAKNLSGQLKNGEKCAADMINTMADGVRVAHIGSVCRPILESHIDCHNDIISVSESEIRTSLELIWTRLKQRVEPTAALAFAAVVHHKPENVKNPLIILCGGNVDPSYSL